MNKVVIAYIPVIHQGYLNFLKTHADADVVYLLDTLLIAEFEHLRKDIRALTPLEAQQALTALNLNKKIELLSTEKIKSFPVDLQIVMPEEDILHELAEKYLGQHVASQKIQFDSVFLRWDKKNSIKEVPVVADEEISTKEFDQKMINLAENQSQKSADWWRQVGIVVIKNGEVILKGYNRHIPGEQQPYYDGDPRGNFHKGEYIEISTALHAEAGVIAHAAKNGVSLQDTSMYVTTFPCPNCAKLVAYSGVKEIFYTEGYAMVDGEKILKENGVKIVRVKMQK